MGARTQVGSPLTLVIGLTVLLLLLVAVLTGNHVLQIEREARRSLELKARSAAYVAASHATWVVEANSQAMKRVAATVAQSSQPVGASTDLRKLVGELPVGVHVWVFDKLGNSMFTNEPEYAAYSAAGRDYFEALRNGADRYVGPMFVGRASGRRQFTVAHRITRDGAFAGAAVAFVPADIMAGVWKQMNLGDRSTIGLARTDGWLVARYPAPTEALNLASHDLFQVHLPKAPHGIYESDRSPADGVARLVSYVRTAQLPLVAIVGIPKGETLSAIVAALTPPVLIGVALLAVSLSLFRVVRDEAHAKRHLAVALEQNQVLLREVHHRVKNNLQTISALVRLQPGLPEAKDALFKRISAIATVHELMCESQNLGRVDFGDYLNTLLDKIEETMAREVRIKRDLGRLVVSIDTAVPLGLIVNEAVANALKHAFRDRASGEIHVTLREIGDGQAEVRVSDDGAGLPEKPRQGIGSRLIDKLAEQIGAVYCLERAAGTVFSVRWPLAPPGML